MSYKNPEDAKAHRAANREKQNANNKRWRDANPEKVSARNKKWRDANPEKAIANTRRWRDANPEKVRSGCKRWQDEHKEDQKIHHAKYYAANKEKLLVNQKIYYDTHKDDRKAYREENKDKIAAYVRNRRRTDPQFRIADNLRRRLNKALKRNTRVGSAVRDLGCSIDFLKQYLEERFQSDMTWNNYGEWEIDHIKPLSSFDLTDRDQLLQACHYTNLQPLWAEENARKGDRLC